MLLPEFTIRNLLTITAGFGVFSTVLAAAVRGNAWAVGICAAVGVACGALALQMVSYLIALPFAQTDDKADAPASPFATDAPPEQVMPPQQSEW